MASESWLRKRVIAIVLLFVASLLVIFYSNNLLKPTYNSVEIQYINSNDTNFVYVSTCANQTRINTVIYKELPPLQDALNAFDWDSVEKAFAEQRKLHPAGNVYLPTDLYEAYLNVLVPYLEQPPKYPIEVATRPVPLSVNCADPKYASILTGKERSKPVKAYDFVPFNAELDVLEMRFYELNDTVDYFVILESTLTHRAMRKPLFYARNTERFAGFQSKIIHLIMDDGDVLKFRHANQADGDDWTIEKLARYLIWTKFLAAFGDPEKDALLIHGDLDEIPSGEAVHHFRHCELKDDILATGLYNYVFDFFHLTTVDPLAEPKIGTRAGHRMDERGGFCRAGCQFGRAIPTVPWTGSHVTYHAKVPFLMWKHVSLAEGGQVPRGDLTWLKDANKVENELVAGRRICCAWDHWPHVADAPIPKPNFIPWFAAHNKKRFYYLFREEGVLLDKPADDSVGIENVFATHQDH